jgi:hypothetical protein
MPKTAAQLLADHNLQKQYLEIGINVCLICKGKGFKSYPLHKTIDECKACDGTGGTKVGVVNE